jgi:hypothetical protein
LLGSPDFGAFGGYAIHQRGMAAEAQGICFSLLLILGSTAKSVLSDALLQTGIWLLSNPNCTHKSKHAD